MGHIIVRGVRVAWAGILAVGLLVAVPTQTHAAAVILQLTIDKLTKGRAVLSGDLDDTAFAFPFPASDTAKATNEVTGTHWRVRTTLFRTTRRTFFEYGLAVDATHKSNPPPHPEKGEGVSNLVIGDFPAIFHFNLGALSTTLGADDPGPKTDSDDKIHVGAGDRDVLTSTVEDLNGAAPGFLDGLDQVAARFDMVHTPEPASLLLLGAGLLGLAGTRRRQG